MLPEPALETPWIGDGPVSPRTPLASCWFLWGSLVVTVFGHQGRDSLSPHFELQRFGDRLPGDIFVVLIFYRQHVAAILRNHRAKLESRA